MKGQTVDTVPFEFSRKRLCWRPTLKWSKVKGACDISTRLCASMKLRLVAELLIKLRLYCTCSCWAFALTGSPLMNMDQSLIIWINNLERNQWFVFACEQCKLGSNTIMSAASLWLIVAFICFSSLFLLCIDLELHFNISHFAVSLFFLSLVDEADQVSVSLRYHRKYS